MAAVGGSLVSLELAGRVYAVPADTDVTIMLGGYQNEVLPNGDGTARVGTQRVPCGIKGCAVSCDAIKGDLEFLQSLADSLAFFPCVATLAGGASYAGNVQVNGELAMSTQSATATFELLGEDKLKRL